MAIWFIVQAIERPRPAVILAAVLWGAYSVYEYYIANGTLCGADCNIRVDLVLFLPILAIATYLGLKKEPSAGAVAILFVVCFGTVALLTSLFGYPVASWIAGGATLVAAAYGVKSTFFGKRA